MAALSIWVAVFFLLGPCTGIPTELELRMRFQTWIGHSLDMAPNSVDDMYDPCADQMEHKIQNEFLEKEKYKTNNFKQAWDTAEEYYNKNKAGQTLKKEQIMAIHAYTLGKPNLYIEFNNAVRTQKSNYKTTFEYQTLHFFLTRALQTLNSAQRCVTGYRRTDKKFNENVLNKEIRFGAFTSSARGGYLSSGFGDKSCFEIYTCFGADISKYSIYESEREVLIPPYEVFKVIKIEKSSQGKKLPCEVVFTLTSTRKTLSNLNCAFFNNAPNLADLHMISYIFIFFASGLVRFIL